MSPPPPLVSERSKCQKMQFQNEIMVILGVKYQFHIQQRYLANAVNYSTANPSFGKKLKSNIISIIIKKIQVTSNQMHT